MKRAQFSFTLYFGAGTEGERNAKMAESGRKLHGYRSLREYILFCLSEIAKRDEKKKPKPAKLDQAA